ncbi:MAG TPA: bifunctional demethylmenaquinone methyltransferase/2-methoxy-6-polyprenyl-1,4-benzoquinol methylase UbiE [Acidobacteriaceae bacterium]|nr:bifunctional demethylmenaquinone methyltransferase/2-methoxy-6-polyprenyl-1,4-benzoquinol methylase UbiE [Acidobacteriaceae bacterium]
MTGSASGAEPKAPGANPASTRDEQDVSHAVRSMFNGIAPRYDLLNHVLSANVDRIWWRRTARTFASILSDPDSAVMDMCCGTGDMTLALLRHRPANGKPVIALDFSHEMLERAKEKFASPELSCFGVITMEADALHMPLPENSFDLITTAFGFRNLANYEAGLREMVRVLRPGAQVGILDFNEPDGFFGKIYSVYFRHILPRIGRVLSGASAPYEYLPHSVHRFPKPEEMLAMMRACGFIQATWTPYTFGIAGLYRAVKA